MAQEQEKQEKQQRKLSCPQHKRRPQSKHLLGLKHAGVGGPAVSGSAPAAGAVAIAGLGLASGRRSKRHRIAICPFEASGCFVVLCPLLSRQS